MLKQLRENTKTILWIVVVAFVISIFAVWGMNLRSPSTRRQDQDVAGSVDGDIIPWQTYRNTFTELLSQLKAQRGEDYNPSASENRMLADQAWELTIQRILLQREIKRLDITVTDNELVTFLRRNPHPQLQQIFRTEDDQFDHQAYLNALADPSVDWTELERWGRAILPEIKLQTYLSSQIHVSDREIREEFKRENTQVRAKYLAVSFREEDPPYEPTDEEITALYEETKEELKDPPKRRIRVIEIERKPTTSDERDVLERIEEIREEILAGTDFAEAAKNYSDDYMSAQNGGDLGFFGKGEMARAFEDAAFALNVGEISTPVRTEYGYHLIRIEEKKTEDGEEKVRARHILMKVEPGYETLDSLSTVINRLSEEIKKNGFEKSAASFDLPIKVTEPFMQGLFIKEIGYVPRVINFSFNYKPGSISSPIWTENAVYIVNILESIPEGVKPLEDVRMQLRERIRRNRIEETAQEAAESIRHEAIMSGDFEGTAHTRGLEVTETPLFTENESIPGIGANTALAKACHMLSLNEISPPIKDQDVYYLITVTERVEPDMSEFDTKRTEIWQRLYNDKLSRFTASWYEAIRKDANVVDLREKLLD